MKRPSFQFYPTDWIKDPAVRSLTLAARGAWIEMLCLMHQCQPRGYLKNADGTAISDRQLARILGVPPGRLRPCLEIMEQLGVFSRDETGSIFCPRLVNKDGAR